MHNFSFEIDPDISRASTPPSDVYNDPCIYEIVKEKIFARSWQFVGHVDNVHQAQQVHPFTLLEGCLDEPLLLTRDKSEKIHCLSNVCTHRGMIVCDEPGRESFLRCRYHGRRFMLDGSFSSMPEFEDTKNFPSDSDHLSHVKLEQWGPFLFANLNPTISFDEWINPVRERMSWLNFDKLKFDATRSKEYTVEANWALYCENYLEGFHIPFVHASLNEVLDFGSYRTELFNYSNLQLGLVQGKDGRFDLPETSAYHSEEVAAFYYWLFPNLMLNFYPWGLSINVVKPLGVDQTHVSFYSYVLDAAKLDKGAGTGLDRVEHEDEEIVALVQTGVRSRLYDRGRYSPTREQGTHHFHGLLAKFLNA